MSVKEKETAFKQEWELKKLIALLKTTDCQDRTILSALSLRKLSWVLKSASAFNKE
jgi:hypothetical protein